LENLKTISCQGSITTLKLPSMLNYKDKVIDGEINVANSFNEHFISIIKLIKRKPLDKTNFTCLKHHADKQLGSHCFDINRLTRFEVKRYI